jgi:hypothetical protein
LVFPFGRCIVLFPYTPPKPFHKDGHFYLRHVLSPHNPAGPVVGRIERNGQDRFVILTFNLNVGRGSHRLHGAARFVEKLDAYRVMPAFRG